MYIIIDVYVDYTMYILILSTIAIGVVLILGILKFLKPGPDPIPAEEEDEPRAQRNGRRAPGGRRENLLAARNAARVQQNDSDNEDGVPPTDVDFDLPEGKVGAKKMAKLQAKAEKKALREAEEKERQRKKKESEEADILKKKQEEKEKLEQEKRLEEERKIKEEKEKREHEEYLKMKEAFSVEEEGFEEGEVDSANLLQDFVNYIKKNKVVVLEDIASQFKLKTQNVIDRIQDLQNENILTGVIDDRGKFIYISQEELDSVAKFVKQRGRVSIVELAENSNKLINLNPNISVAT